MVLLNKKKQGKKNRAAGARFELAVRKDMESEGSIVSKWQNNVEFLCQHKEHCCARLIPARRKFNPFKKVLGIGSGFPDFISFKRENFSSYQLFIVEGVEAKINGYLDKEEREKCKWLLDNNIFGRILIAKKGKKRGEIIYEEFSDKK